MNEIREIIEVNLTMLEREKNKKYSSEFPGELAGLISLAKNRGIQINFIHDFLELKTRDYTQNNKEHKFEMYNLSVLNINQEIPLDAYYEILEAVLINVIEVSERKD